MKREIKFRVWDKNCGKMHYKGSLQFDQDNYKNHKTFFEFDGIESGEICVGDANRDIEIMQYTGMKDKNEKEIHEGDIVKLMEDDWAFTDGWKEEDPRWKDNELFNPMPQKEVMRDVVTLDRFGLWLKNESFGYEGESLVSPSDCIVIGNIYENQELINNTK